MAVTINADTSNGLVMTPDTSGEIKLQSAGTDIVSVTANGMAVDTNTLYVDATNNAVLVGKTSIDYTTVGFEATPNSIFQANAMTSDGTKALLMSRKTNDGELIQFRRDTTQVGSIGAVSGGIYFGSGTSSTERMRMTSNGTIIIEPADSNHTTTADTSGFEGDGGYASTYFCRASFTSTKYMARFYNPNGKVGQITTSGTATAYTTSSDYRLKENNVLINDGISRVKLLKPYRFNFITDSDTTVDGFFAHEVQDVVPEAIHGTKDAMHTEEYEVTPAVLDDDGNVVTEAVMGTREVPDYQGIDQAKLVPLLTAALQEAITKIEDLETRIQALENA